MFNRHSSKCRFKRYNPRKWLIIGTTWSLNKTSHRIIRSWKALFVGQLSYLELYTTETSFIFSQSVTIQSIFKLIIKCLTLGNRIFMNWYHNEIENILVLFGGYTFWNGATAICDDQKMCLLPLKPNQNVLLGLGCPACMGVKCFSMYWRPIQTYIWLTCTLRKRLFQLLILNC